MALAQTDLPELKRFTFFVSRRFEEGRERFRLHMGYFATLAEAEEWLNVVREIYPGAWAGEAPGRKLRERAAAAAAAQAQHAAGPQPRRRLSAAGTLRPPRCRARAPPSGCPARAGQCTPLRRCRAAPRAPRPRAPAACPPLRNRQRCRRRAAGGAARAPRRRRRRPAAQRPQRPRSGAGAPPRLPPRDPCRRRRGAGRRRAAVQPVAAPPAGQPPAAGACLPGEAGSVRRLQRARSAGGARRRQRDRRDAPDACAAAAARDAERRARSDVSDTQVLQLLESAPPRHGRSRRSRTDRRQLSRCSSPTTPARARALKEAVASNAPVSFAVQLQWSVQPVELDKVPPLAIFSAYTLYTVEGSREGRKWYGLRLGFFSDAISAKQVAHYVRSEFASVAVVPVSPQEKARATDDDRRATLGAGPAPRRSERGTSSS